MLRNSFYFSFFSNFDWLGTNLVPIEQGRELLKISFKLSIGWKLTLIDWNMNKSYSIDRKPIEPTREQWLKIKEFLISWKTHSIDWNSGNLNFWKTAKDYVETTQPKWLFGVDTVICPPSICVLGLEKYKNIIFSPWSRDDIQNDVAQPVRASEHPKCLFQLKWQNAPDQP